MKKCAGYKEGYEVGPQRGGDRRGWVTQPLRTQWAIGFLEGRLEVYHLPTFRSFQMWTISVSTSCV